MSDTLSHRYFDVPDSREVYEPVLLHGASMQLAYDRSIYSPSDLGMQTHDAFGAEVKIVGEIGVKTRFGKREAVIFGADDGQGGMDFAIAGLYRDDEGNMRANNRYFVLPRQGQINVVSSSTSSVAVDATSQDVTDLELWGEDLGDAISPMQLAIFQKDKTLVVDDLSANGTFVRGIGVGRVDTYKYFPKKTHTHAITQPDRVAQGEDGDFYFVDSNGKSVRVVGSGTFPIEGTIDIKNYGLDDDGVVVGERLLVDSVNGSREQQEQYSLLKGRVFSRIDNLSLKLNRALTNLEVAKIINTVVSSGMRHDPNFVAKHSRELAQRTSDSVENLAYYLKEGRGVCRHSRAATVWVTCEAIDAGYLDAMVFNRSVDHPDEASAHAFARVVPNDGSDIIVIDPTNNVADTLSGIYARIRAGEKIWKGYFDGYVEAYSYMIAYDNRRKSISAEIGRVGNQKA